MKVRQVEQTFVTNKDRLLFCDRHCFLFNCFRHRVCTNDMTTKYYQRSTIKYINLFTL